jgi:hypothetical protein
MEDITDGQPASVMLVYFSGVLGFSADCRGFLPARSYTPSLSALIYIQRLLFLEYALPARAYELLSIDQRSRTGQLARLQQVRSAYMVMGAQSAFNEHASLLAFGWKLAESETPPFLLHWSEDGQSVSHSDMQPISMGRFRHLPRALLEDANRLCSELMYGLQAPVDLASLKDNMASTAPGFSFVSHPANKLTEAYLALSVRACTNHLESLSRGGRWDWKAVCRYLKKEQALCELLSALLLITGGGLPRGPCLLGLRYQNTPTAERGIYAHDGSIVYVTRSHKAKRSTNREFIVARFLPAQVAHLVYWHAVYVRPFADMLVREQGLDSNGCSSYLFRAKPAHDSLPWPTARLTSVVKHYTEKVWGQAVSLRMLRQLAIGVTERHVREVSRPFNRFDDKSERADSNVVFAWQSGHRPLQRARTYGLDGAFPTKLQPQLLEQYAVVSSRWHEFLHLPSKLRPQVDAGSIAAPVAWYVA